MPPTSPHSPFAYFLLLLFFFLATTTFVSSSTTSKHKPSAFLVTSCSTTLYPSLCLHTLSPFPYSSIHHSRRRLAYASLLVTHRHALAATSYVSALARQHRHHSSPALRDCVEMISDSAYQIQRCIRQMLDMGRPTSRRFPLSLSNVQTWGSAALTDLTTCLDGFDEDLSSGGAIKAAVGARVGVVMRVNSNSLALINLIQTEEDGETFA